jgi:site-specific DNA-methyltransferase (adenine-specific)
MEYLIKTYSNHGDTVCDPFLGSGSTGVACVNLERSFIGIELDQKYFDMAEERIKFAQKERQLTFGGID